MLYSFHLFLQIQGNRQKHIPFPRRCMPKRRGQRRRRAKMIDNVCLGLRKCFTLLYFIFPFNAKQDRRRTATLGLQMYGDPTHPNELPETKSTMTWHPSDHHRYLLISVPTMHGVRGHENNYKLDSLPFGAKFAKALWSYVADKNCTEMLKCRPLDSDLRESPSLLESLSCAKTNRY